MKAIFAVDTRNGIGKNGTLPWPKNKEDFAWFKQHTTGKTVVMGRNTWDDPAFPKPLPNRTNIVVTSKPIDVPGVLTISNINIIPEDAIVIGGSNLIKSLSDKIDTIYLTRFNADYECDVFVDLDQLLDNFKIIESKVVGDLIFETWITCKNT